jgi:hypothetical protein
MSGYVNIHGRFSVEVATMKSHSLPPELEPEKETYPV